MSHSDLTLVPQQTGLVPAADRWEAGRQLLRRLRPQVPEVEAVLHASIELFDCGVNLEAVHCPICKTELGLDRWSDWMSADYAPDGTGFRLGPAVLPCCGRTAALDALIYHWPMAFGRFGLRTQGASRLTPGEVGALETALRCHLIPVERHL